MQSVARCISCYCLLFTFTKWSYRQKKKSHFKTPFNFLWSSDSSNLLSQRRCIHVQSWLWAAIQLTCLNSSLIISPQIDHRQCISPKYVNKRLKSNKTSKFTWAMDSPADLKFYLFGQKSVSFAQDLSVVQRSSSCRDGPTGEIKTCDRAEERVPAHQVVLENQKENRDNLKVMI